MSESCPVRTPDEPPHAASNEEGEGRENEHEHGAAWLHQQLHADMKRHLESDAEKKQNSLYDTLGRCAPVTIAATCAFSTLNGSWLTCNLHPFSVSFSCECALLRTSVDTAPQGAGAAVAGARRGARYVDQLFVVSDRPSCCTCGIGRRLTTALLIGEPETS